MDGDCCGPASSHVGFYARTFGVNPALVVVYNRAKRQYVRLGYLTSPSTLAEKCVKSLWFRERKEEHTCAFIIVATLKTHTVAVP